ncbi:MAG: class II glutamine amidotransferase [Bacteroidetes bacterium]|nr:MAG: class II glutamine amidotransferase [Bacteroidota bacterium]MBL1144198.1 class II glutamine amidotransferase [Bacteroidota bacterium]MCB0802942.1 class II glutamine amidotransferase [Flavobacteriales bacterium]NOG56994.1 class II glutamine amidotransferase [Bacteroidota bacterium]
MCRLLAYLGNPILMHKLIIEPKNSLINQSTNAQEIEEPLNGDGFGIAWYNHILTDKPAVFTSISPAWSNKSLQSISPSIKSTCFFAHVRAASVGELAETNCHPFAYKNLTMMHNGDVGEFSKYKRAFRRRLSDELYNWIKGQTDSEHLFALFIDTLNRMKKTAEITAELMADALKEAVLILEEIKKEANVSETSYLNLVVGDGERMVGLRYVSDPKITPLSLYYSEGMRYECENGLCKMLPAIAENHSTLIVSEKLSNEIQDWKPIPANHFVLVFKDLSIKLRPF